MMLGFYQEVFVIFQAAFGQVKTNSGSVMNVVSRNDEGEIVNMVLVALLG